jgi:16S rRNA (adenine1518-N6/adenine1519-N6)-dimethyltransferase
VRLSGLGPEDTALEIGPGLGILTREIARVARRTIALEVDRGLVELLLGEDLPASVEIRHQDALRADLAAIARELAPPRVLLGNLPYRIAGRLLGGLLAPGSLFRRWALMLQAEVADRVLAEPGMSAYGPLAVWARIWTQTSRVLELGPAQFEPRPRVRSSFVLFDPIPDPPAVADPALLRQVVRSAFQHRRKTLRAALRGRVPGAEAALEGAGIDPGRRGETLSPEEFLRLADAVHAQEGVP